jgi:hypothetical protein
VNPYRARSLLRPRPDLDDDEALVFKAKVDGLELTGCDFLSYDADGQITELMVMVRPLRAAQALAGAMAARWEAIQAEAVAAS